jgi:SOS-response transcriptional repressor LexA
MAPIIQDGYVIAVDYSQNDHTPLNGKIVIAWNRDKGLTVSCFKRYDHTEVLEPENRWKSIAQVLWWIGKAA